MSRLKRNCRALVVPLYVCPSRRSPGARKANSNDVAPTVFPVDYAGGPPCTSQCTSAARVCSMVLTILAIRSR